MITTYPNAENVLYSNTFDGDSEPSPIAIFNSNENWEIFLFGFPLYYMQPQEVRSMMLSLFSSTSPPVSNDNSVEEVALVVGVYPNPVQDKLNLKIAGSRSGTFDASVYNIKGQKVREYSGLEVKSGKTVIELSSDSGSLSNGIYFVRVTVDNKNVVRKVMILK
ncbi:MAG: hypothetical protein B6226_05610 [Candidatus Cloacimonetes bacterium 4572_65]|nr:MAG: hypothetical protein B6226_05610 [Candidatus Cloacimonetes bacterium 4572_65]